MFRISAFVAVIAVIVHLVLGWAWTVLAGLLGGWLLPQKGARVGLLGVGVAWLLLVCYSFFVDAGAVLKMGETMGGILGGLPGWTFFVITLCLGGILGALGGFAGGQLQSLFQRSK